jgi:Spy/CpxP family protein refolding chaperone
MKSSTALTVFLSLVLTVSFVFASIEFRRMSGTMSALEDRLARIESSSAPRTDAGTPHPGEEKHAAGSSGDISSELAKIREDIAALRTSPGSRSTGASDSPDGAPVVAKGGPALSKDDLSKAVQDALVQKEKVDKEKQARAYKKQLEVSAKSWAESLAKKLDLTETQKGQLATIFADQWGRMNTAWNETQENENAEAVDYNKLQTETNEKVKLVLTPEQGAKYDELMKKGNMWGGAVETTDESDSSSK